MAFELAEPPGFTDVPDSLLAANQGCTGFIMSAIKDNASFGSVVPEPFYTTQVDGDTVALPQSQTDGYQYSREELIYMWDMVNTTNQGNGLPSANGAVLWYEQFVEPDTGKCHSTVAYYVDGGAQTNTSDGVLGVWTFGIRGRRLRTIATSPSYTDLASAVFSQDDPATTGNITTLSHNAKLGGVQCEVFPVNPSNAPTWQAAHSYVEGDLVQPTGSRANGFWYIAANSGTSGGLEPEWPAVWHSRAPIIDNGVIWNVAGAGFYHGQQILYPKSYVDDYQYSSSDTIYPFLAFISTQALPRQKGINTVWTSGKGPARAFTKKVTPTQPAYPTSTTWNSNNLWNLTNTSTVWGPTIQNWSAGYTAPAAEVNMSAYLSPGTPSTGVGIVDAEVCYQNGFFNDGTVMVWLVCFRHIGTMASPGGANFTDISTDDFTSGNSMLDTYMGDINENTKFSILRPEIFYDATPTPGSTLPTPTSTVDSYGYVRGELTYMWCWQNTGSAPGHLRDFSIEVNPQTGVVCTRTDYFRTTGGGGIWPISLVSSGGTVIATASYGYGGQTVYTNMDTTGRGSITSNVIVLARRQHETELINSLIISTPGNSTPAPPSPNNLVPNGGFEIWSIPNTTAIAMAGVADDWGILQNSGTTDFSQEAGLKGIFAQGIGAKSEGGTLSDRVRQAQGAQIASIASMIIPIWPGGTYQAHWTAAASPVAIDYGFYVRAHLLAADSAGNPDTTTDTTFDFLGTIANQPGTGSADNPGTSIGFVAPASQQWTVQFQIPLSGAASATTSVGQSILSQVINFTPQFLYLEFLVWDAVASTSGVVFAIIDDVSLIDISEGAAGNSAEPGVTEDWNSTTAYNAGDRVLYQGVWWLCYVANTNQTPSTTSTYWILCRPTKKLIAANSANQATANSIEVGAVSGTSYSTTSTYLNITTSGTLATVSGISIPDTLSYVKITVNGAIASTNASAAGWGLSLVNAAGTTLMTWGYMAFATDEINASSTYKAFELSFIDSTGSDTYTFNVATNSSGTISFIPVYMSVEVFKR